jgi:hypothetical protein
VVHGRGWQTENFARGSNPLVLEMSFLVKMRGSVFANPFCATNVLNGAETLKFGVKIVVLWAKDVKNQQFKAHEDFSIALNKSGTSRAGTGREPLGNGQKLR